MVTYWRDTAQPSATRVLTVSDDDPRLVLERASEVAEAWMRGADDEPPADDEPLSWADAL